VQVADGYAYVAGEDLHIIDVRNPEEPEAVGSYNTVDRVYGVAVYGNYAYIPQPGGLHILDVSNRAEPREVRVDRSVPAGAVLMLHGDHLYVGGNGLYIMDLSNPTAPRVVGSYSQAVPSAVVAAGGYIYVADRGSGLFILDFNEGATMVHLPFVFGQPR
jgi:hypothetical protein